MISSVVFVSASKVLTSQLDGAAAAGKRLGEKAGTHEIRLSMDVSIGLVFRDFKNDASPGVNGADEGGMIFGCIII